MYVIKKVIREGILETNSSSSHSVCICMDGSLSNSGDRTWDLDIRNGILYVPEPVMEFGRNEFKSNRCLLKIQYAYGLAYHARPVDQYRVTDVIKKVTGVHDVHIEWVEDFKRKMVENYEKYNEIYVHTPDIDHQSTHLFSEVFETEETLKEFIFNPKSWVYGGSDEIEWTDNFRKDCIIPEKEFEAKLIIHLGGQIGDVDILVDNFVSECIFSLGLEKVSGLYWDEEKDMIFYECPGLDALRKKRRGYLVDYDYKQDSQILKAINPILGMNKGNLCLLVFNKLPKTPFDEVTLLRGTYQLEVDYVKKSIPGISFKEFPAELISRKFGKLL